MDVRVTPMWKGFCLISCFAVTLGCGTLYAYSAYAPQLSERLALSASTISSIGMLGNFSMSLSGPFAGLIVDTNGFLIPICCSILSAFFGYGLIYFLYEKTISSILLLCCALVLVGISSTCAFSASVKCAALNFPKIRGTATAITMSGYGLSAFLMSLVAQLTSNGEGNGASHILLVLTVLPALLMAVFGPIVIKHQNKKISKGKTVALNSPTSPEEYSLDSLTSELNALRENEIYGFGLLKQVNFWLYFLILGVMAGMGQAYIYTCGYMVKALVTSNLDDPTKINQNLLAPLQAHQVGIISVANCVGRLLSGAFSDMVKTQLKLPRVASLSFALSLGLSAMISARNLTTFSYMWVPSCLMGLFYGAIYGAFPGIVSDSFGVKRLSSNWGVVALAPIPFSSFLAIRIGKAIDRNKECRGAECFASAYTLHVALAICAFGLLVLACRNEWKHKHMV